jgi:excisionase family DNA binding protein
MADESERDAYTVEQSRHRLGGISRQTVYNLINSGDLASFTIGSRRLIPAAAIRNFIERQTATAVRPSDAA